MGSKKKQTVGYKYFASGHFVLCHGPVDSITKISFQDKAAYEVEKSANTTIYINKPSLFGGDEQSGGVQGNVELLFGHAYQAKNSTLQRICAQISDSFNGLISAWRGVTSVVFDNVYIGTAPNLPESKWRVKRIHTRHDGQNQWYDEKAEINTIQFANNFVFNFQHKYIYETNFGQVGGFDKNLSTNYEVNKPFYQFNEGSVSGAVEQIEVTHIFSFDDSLSVLAEFEFEFNANVAYENTFNTDAQIISESDFVINNVLHKKIVIHIKNGNYLKAKTVANGENNSLLLSSGIFTHLYSESSEADINPAHIIRECLTNKIWGIGVAESSIDDVAFKKAADVLFNESMGMSIKWTDSTTIQDFVSNVLEHINAQLYLDRITNKWTLYLIRDDYDKANLISLDESNIRNLDFERRTLAECINCVTVTYWDRERSKDSTVTVQDIARIAQQGGVISQSIDYKGFTNSDLASRVALRELKTLSATLASISFEADESLSETWHVGMPFKLSDSSYGLSEAIMRISSIKRGDGINNAIYVEAIEDSFSSPMQSVVEYVPIISMSDDALDAKSIAFEVPYIELVEQYGQDEVDAKLLNYPDLGYVGMAAIRPNNKHINASLFVDSGAGYDERTTLDFCPSASLKNAIGYTESSFELKNVAEFQLLQANNRIQINKEIMAFIGFDASTNIVTVKRGCFDTVPQKHDANSLLFGWDNYSGIDSTEYLSGETVSLKALTMTGSDQLAFGEATAHIVDVFARAIRPYPPANVKFNDTYFPETLIVTNNIVLTWAHRNRAQQTGGEIIGWYEGEVTAEDGVTYSYELISENVVLASATGITSNTATILASSLIPNKPQTLKLWSVRDGFDSYQIFEHSFFAESVNLILTATATKSNVAGSTVPTANINVVIDESLKANMKFDGSSISGKAPAGATITIEVNE